MAGKEGYTSLRPSPPAAQDVGREAANRPRRPLRRRPGSRRDRPDGGLRGRLLVAGGLLRPADRLARRQPRPVDQRARPDARQQPGRRALPAHPAGTRRARHPGLPPGADRLAAGARARAGPARLRVHRGGAAGRGGPARRTPGHHPLELLRAAGPRPPGRPGRSRADLRTGREAGHLGGRHGGDRPGPRARRGGPRAGPRADHRPAPRGVPAPPRQPGPVQRPAQRPDRSARTTARGPALDHPAPGRRPRRRRPRGPRPALAPALRPRVPGGDRDDPRAVRGAGSPGARPPAAGGHRRRRGAGRPRQRLRHPGGHAPRLREEPRDGTGVEYRRRFRTPASTT